MNTRAVTVRALLANEDGALKPGMFLNVALANDERESLIIPEQALTPEAERQFVFVVADGKAQRREVRIGARRPGSVEVLAGLSAGEQVIVEGTQKVRDGVAGARHGNRGRRGARWPSPVLARGQHRRCRRASRQMMISDLSVRRPVFATVMSLLLFILGLGAITRLPARIPRRRAPGGEHRDALPRRLLGRGRVAHHADHRERDLGYRRRRAPQLLEPRRTLADQRRVHAGARPRQRRQRRARAPVARGGRLPLEADPPQITKVDSGADPIIWLNVASTQRNMLELTDYMERYLVDQFATLEGVASVRMNGARRYAMRVWLSRENLAARQLTVADVENSLLRENVEMPAGRLESQRTRVHAAHRHQPAHRGGLPQPGRGPRARRLPGAPRRSGGGAPGLRRRPQHRRARTAPSACRWPSFRSPRPTCSRPPTR